VASVNYIHVLICMLHERFIDQNYYLTKHMTTVTSKDTMREEYLYAFWKSYYYSYSMLNASKQ